MNDAIIQHHFDEVFLALQDVENFEIFSKMKKGNTPKIHRTLVKLVESTEDDSLENQNVTEEPPNLPKFASQLRNFLNRSNNNTPLRTPSNSGPSSRSAVTKLVCNSSKLKINMNQRTNPNTGSESTKSCGVKKLHSSTIMKKGENSVEMRNTLFECQFCGRFILGDFLEIHEEKCGSDTL